MCPEHECKLLDSSVRIKGPSKKFFQADELNCENKNVIRYPSDIHEKILQISKEAYKIVTKKFPFKPDGWFEEAYLFHLSNTKLVKTNQHVNLTELIKRITEYYGEAFLEIMESKIEHDPKKHGWL